MTKEQLNSIMTRLPESKVMIDALTVETDTPFKRIYISGKISGLHPEDARQNFQFAERELRTYHQTNNIINPFSIRPFLGIKCWLFYMISDIREQSTCTHSAFMYNWLESRGAVIEYFFARFIFKHHIIFLPS